MAPYEALQAERGLTHFAFGRLLEWLDDKVDSRRETYFEMRRRLVLYFDRRNRRSADELADETLNRIGRTLENDGAIGVSPPARYCYAVARFILLEDVRREQTLVRLDEAGGAGAPATRGTTHPEAEGLAAGEQRLESLDRCLRELTADQRELVREYYRGAGRQKIERRRDMAMRLGITVNALGIRACRTRQMLEGCMGPVARSGDRM